MEKPFCLLPTSTRMTLFWFGKVEAIFSNQLLTEFAKESNNR